MKFVPIVPPSVYMRLSLVVSYDGKNDCATFVYRNVTCALPKRYVITVYFLYGGLHRYLAIAPLHTRCLIIYLSLRFSGTREVRKKSPYRSDLRDVEQIAAAPE